MSLSLAELERFLQAHRQVVLVEISRAVGSTPREKGAFMLVGAKDMAGTIGGGQVEYIAVDAARRMLRNNDKERQLEVALGPEIGQCCGGHVTLSLNRVDRARAEQLAEMVAEEMALYRHVYIMGAGHVGRALARALAPLPLKTVVVDTRHEALAGLAKNVETRHAVLPEAEVRAAPRGSSFIVLTHDHALDFLITREALMRDDAFYVGMIGSKSKRAAFAAWMRSQGVAPERMEALICPIGGRRIKDKRPAIIAALVVAQILVHTERKRTDKVTGETKLPASRGENIGGK